MRQQEARFRKMMVASVLGLFLVLTLTTVFVAPALLNLAMDTGLVPRIDMPI